VGIHHFADGERLGLPAASGRSNELTWLPLSDNGYMVAAYIGVSYNNLQSVGCLPWPFARMHHAERAMYTTSAAAGDADAPLFSALPTPVAWASRPQDNPSYSMMKARSRSAVAE